MLAGCSAGDRVSSEEADPVVRRDSAGVEIVSTRVPAWSEETQWAVEATPSVVVRTSEEMPPFILFRVGDITSLSDGRIVIANVGSTELVVTDSTGAYLDTWGAKGQGPGEFEEINRMFSCAGDTIVVEEDSRTSVLDGTGNLQRVLQRRRDVRLPSRLVIQGTSSDCSASLWGWWPRESLTSSRGTSWSQFMLAWVGRNQESIDTVGRVTIYELNVTNGVELPFSLMPDWAIDGTDVYYARGDRAEVRVIRSDGELKRLIRWKAPPPAEITDSIWQQYLAEFEHIVDYEPPWDNQRTTREMVPYDSMPLFGKGHFSHDRVVPGVLVDDENNLWVRRYEYVPMTQRLPHMRASLPAQEWWVFDPTGRWLGEIRMPSNFLIRAIQRDKIMGLSRDDLDVEQVRIYRIRKPSGSA